MEQVKLQPRIYFSGGPVELKGLAELAPQIERDLGGLWAGLARRDITAVF